MSKYMDEQLKLAQKVLDVVDRPYRKIYSILLWYNVDKPRISYAQVRRIARKEDDKFQQVVYVNYRLEEFIYILDLMIFVSDEFSAYKPICNVL